MDTKEFISRLSMESGISTEEVNVRVDILSSILRTFCKELDAVSMPGFGTFQPVKEDEIVVKDNDGQSILLPPAVEVKFKSSIILRKALGK